MSKTTDEEVLSAIEAARARNNINWLDIVRIALKYAPEETRAVLRRINSQDLDIAYYTQRLANEDQPSADRPRV